MIYMINMSKGKDIKIDEEDLQKLKDNIKAPLIQLKQGIINPSFMISIVPTEEKDVIQKPIFQHDSENRVSRVVGYEEVKLLENKMQIKNNDLSKR